MSIIARCACGKRVGVAEVLAGRTIRCPQCGDDVLVPMAADNAPVASSKRNVDATPAISISPGLLLMLIVGGILGAIALALYMGPWRVGNQWAAMSTRANGEVTDVVLFALQAYESQHGMYDPAASHRVPTIDAPATFFPPMLSFTLPRHMVFNGKTNQGNYAGTYDTTNGEIVSDIEYGGWSMAGIADLRKATSSIHITGREKDGHVEAELDGQPLAVATPKTIER